MQLARSSACPAQTGHNYWQATLFSDFSLHSPGHHARPSSLRRSAVRSAWVISGDFRTCAIRMGEQHFVSRFPYFVSGNILSCQQKEQQHFCELAEPCFASALNSLCLYLSWTCPHFSSKSWTYVSSRRHIPLSLLLKPERTCSEFSIRRMSTCLRQNPHVLFHHTWQRCLCK